MTPDEALRVLGLDRSVSWSEVQARHRALIRTEHPDAGGDPAKAAALNQAMGVLDGATLADATARSADADADADADDHGARAAANARPATPAGIDRLLHLRVEPGDLLMRLAEAGHLIGEVVFVDPLAGLLEVVVGEGRAAAQLAVTVGEPRADEVPVAFMLEPLGAGASPPSIDAVVDDLVAAVEAADRR